MAFGMDYHEIFLPVVVSVEVCVVQMVRKFRAIELFRVIQQSFVEKMVSYFCPAVGAMLHDVAGFERS